MHIGRAFTGTRIEDECPCEQEACGLVSSRTISEDCPQHSATKTIRQGHTAEECPAWPSLEERLRSLTVIYEGRVEADPQETVSWSEVAQDLRLLLQGANPGASA